MIDGSGSRSVSVTNGSGSGRPKKHGSDGPSSATLLFGLPKTTKMSINGMKGTNGT